MKERVRRSCGVTRFINHRPLAVQDSCQAIPPYHATRAERSIHCKNYGIRKRSRYDLLHV